MALIKNIRSGSLNEIDIIGNLDVSGSLRVSGFAQASSANILTYDTASGQISYTASSAVGGGVTAAGSDTQIQYNSGGTFGATGSFRFIYASQSLQQGLSVQAIGQYSHAEGNQTKTGTQNAYSASVVNGIVTMSAAYPDVSSEFVANNRMYLYDAPFDGNYGRAIFIISQSYYNSPNTIVELYNTSVNTTIAYVGDIDYGTDTWTGDQTIPGNYAHAEGYQTLAIGNSSHADGDNTQAIGDYSHAEGIGTKALRSGTHSEGQETIAFGANSHAEGAGTQAIGEGSHAEGAETQAIGDYSHAEGYGAAASGSYSHAEGYGVAASGSYSHAEGNGTQAVGNYSHAEGSNTQAIGNNSHAEGGDTQAVGDASHTEGRFTITSGSYSHAEGVQTVTSASYQHVQGIANIGSEVTGAFIVGNGTVDQFGSVLTRSNLIYAAGNTVEITGSLDVSGSARITDVLTLPYQDPLPSSPATGSIALSGSGATFVGMFVWTGAWTQV